jgi:hypothetical protein
MACNSSAGWFDVDLASQLGIVSFDWSNHKAHWAAQKPMTCEEDLVTQASMVAARGGPGRVFTYFNLVKALPWYASVRALIADPAYSGFFLRFSPPAGALPFSPPCDPVTGDCSALYHDQSQTPAVPGSPPPFNPDGVCDGFCDCGRGVPCGEYIWDHRNASAREWLVSFLLGPSFLGAPGGTIHGLFIDDFWCSNLLNGTGSCTDPAQGPTEVERHSQADMGLSDEDVRDITQGWLRTMTEAQAALVGAGGYTWSLLPGQDNANAAPRMLARGAPCATSVRAACGGAWEPAPLVMGLTPGKNLTADPLPLLQQELAAFLLMRGGHAYLGWGEWGMSWPAGVTWQSPTGASVGLPPLLRRGDWGLPHGRCSEVAPSVFERVYDAGTVRLNCSSYEATLPASFF